MPEIHLCEIPEAYAVNQQNGSRWVELWLPEQPVMHTDAKFGQSAEYAGSALQELRTAGTARIATPEQPLKPPSAGMLDLLVDEHGYVRYIVMFEKDPDSPRTKGYHVTFHGYPSSSEEWHTFEHAKREPAEEVLYALPNGEAILPGDYRSITERALDQLARRLRDAHGIDVLFGYGDNLFHPHYVEGHDKILMQNDNGTDVFDAAVVWFPYVDAIQYRHIPLVDAGMHVHDLEGFGRDAVLIRPDDLRGKQFGDRVRARVMRYPRKGKDIASYERIVEEGVITFKPIPALQQALHELDLGDGPIYLRDWTEPAEFARISALR